MKLRLLSLLCLLLLRLGNLQISAAAETDAPKSPPTTPRIEWDSSTLTLIQSNGYYGRIIRLKNRQLVCGYDYAGGIWIRHSSDEGKTWRAPVKVAEWPHGRLTNTELLQLRDGAVLCFYNERPRRHSADTNDAPARPYRICMTRSDDNGLTWQPPQNLYTAGTEFNNGCWEPAAIELPSGEVQVFFSNEGTFRNSDEQEIVLLRSTDGARTWGAPETVSFRPGARDGMPVPLILKDKQGIAFSIEDNGLSGNFKPVIVFTTLEDNWHSGVRRPESTNRWSALRELPPPHVSASAPYLRQMPSGETILSFQRSETGQMENARMFVCIGDEHAKNFGSPTKPFPDTSDKAQLWNSLFVKNAQTIIAVTETSLNGVFGIWSIEGRFTRKK